MDFFGALGAVGQGLTAGLNSFNNQLDRTRQQAEVEHRNTLDMLDLALKAGDSGAANQYATALHAPIDFTGQVQRGLAMQQAQLQGEQARTGLTQAQTGDIGWSEGYKNRELAQNNQQFLADLGVKRDDLTLRRQQVDNEYRLGVSNLGLGYNRLAQDAQQFGVTSQLRGREIDNGDSDRKLRVAEYMARVAAGKAPDPSNPLTPADALDKYNAHVQELFNGYAQQLGVLGMPGVSPSLPAPGGAAPSAPGIGASPSPARYQGYANDFQQLFGKGTVTSILRSPQHNAEVGGAPNSYHLLGEAIDTVPSLDQAQAAIGWGLANGMHVYNEGNHIHFEPSTTGQGWYSTKPGAQGPYYGIQPYLAIGAPTGSPPTPAPSQAPPPGNRKAANAVLNRYAF